MAQSAIARHIDRRAAAMHQEARYSAWAKRIAGPVNRYPFLARRLREWTLFRVITLALPWSADALIDALKARGKDFEAKI